MQSILEKMGGTYTKVGDYYIPNLEIAEDSATDDRPLGKYGMLRETYLKEHRPGFYNSLLLTGKLDSHLHDFDEKAQSMLDRLIP